MKRFLSGIVLGMVLYSCQMNKSAVVHYNLQGGVYAGTLPCQDCEGINQVVILDSGHTFRLTETYHGNSNKTASTLGRWTQKEGELVLYTDTVPFAKFAVMGNDLVYLDQNTISFPGTGPVKLSRRKLINSKEVNRNFLAGLDLMAVANDGSWNMEIHHKKGIRISLSDGATLSFSRTIPKYNGDSLIYYLEKDNRTIQVAFIPGFCIDDASGKIYDYRVIISDHGNQYSGCGSILNADGTIEGHWSLVSFDDGDKNWTEPPFLVVDLAREVFMGYSGCNKMSGTFRFRSQNICFSDINSTKSNCGNYDESAFIDALIKCNGYFIERGILHLQQDGKTMMRFKRE